MNAILLFWGMLTAAVGFGAWALWSRNQARTESGAWRTRHEGVQLELARAGAQVEVLGSLEKERNELRERLDYVATERSRLETLAERLPGLEHELAAVHEELVSQKASNAALMAKVEEQAEAHREKVAALTDVKSGIERDLKAMAAEALQANQGIFLELANQAFAKHKVGADADLEARQKAVEKLIAPLQETLGLARQQIDQLERNRSEAYGALFGELKSVAETQAAVRTETSKLVQALRASPKTRGRWGEHTLQNVLELAGLSAYCDFSTEETFDRPDGRVRPDVVIRMPGGRHLVVDAKTSVTAYLDAIEAVTDADPERHLAQHAVQTRDHMKKLASKSYWDGLLETPDFVVMFIPGENFFAAALERDPDLLEDAAAQRIILVTPSTLIALAKAVAFGWRQEKVADNARKVHEIGRDLYQRMTTMAEHIQSCGGHLGKSVKCFNEFVGSLEQSVMPKVRRFNELEVEGTSTEIPALKPVETEVRLLRADRDFAGQLAASANSEANATDPPASAA
jgi:DNA recombination protein RmuC